MMKEWKSIMTAMAVILVMTWTPVSFGAVSPEEAAKLGTTLTGIGAEMAGNKDGTIPPYTGGLTTAPAGFNPGSGVRPDPFAAEKPLFSINAQNMNQYAEKLPDGTKLMMKKFPTYRIDIYKTHRTIAIPEFVIKHTAKNAVNAQTYNGGLSVKNAHAGIPFPIPKDGCEVMWNHILRYQGRSYESKSYSLIVDAGGKFVLTGGLYFWQEFPYYDTSLGADDPLFWKIRWLFFAPSRRTGESAQAHDYINYYERPRVAHQYLAGQRRVKLAPEIAFDALTTDTSGNATWDETWVFNGSMERYDWKIIGKKEMYVPYNNYKLTYFSKQDDLFKPIHMNPDEIRWELHRVWVVEAKLKPGKRHIYETRRFYLDEDSWTIVAAEAYDANGKLFKVNHLYLTQNYDEGYPCTYPYSHYNFANGVYVFQFWLGNAAGLGSGYIRQAKPHTSAWWTPDTMATLGMR